MLGDKLYGPDEGIFLRSIEDGPSVSDLEALGGMARQALHASSLAFDHPRTGARVTVDAPLPADMAAALAAG